MNSLQRYASEMRNLLLDAHESACSMREKIAAIEEESLDIHAAAFRRVILQREHEHASTLMALAHSLDRLAESAGD